MIRALTILFTLLQASLCVSQNAYFLLESLDKVPGLPNQKTLCMDIDSKGFVWLGTTEGLYRFDGNSATRYQHLPTALSNVTITTILCTPNDELWCGTSNHGAIKINLHDDSFTQYTHQINDSTSIAKNRIKTIFQDDQSNIWIGTHISGLNKYVADSNSFVRILPSQYFPDNIARNINDFLDCQIDDLHPHIAWISTLDGLLKLNTRTNKLQLFFPPENTMLDKRTVQPPQVLRRFVKKGSHVYAGTWGAGMAIIDLETNSWEQVLIPKSNTLSSKKINYRVFQHPYAPNQLLVSSAQNGLYNYNIATKEFEYLSDEEIRGVKKFNDDYNYIINVYNQLLLNRTPGQHIEKVSLDFPPSAIYYRPEKEQLYISRFLENQIMVMDTGFQILDKFQANYQFNKKHYWVGAFRHSNGRLLFNNNRSIYEWPVNQSRPSLLPFQNENPFSVNDPILSFCEDIQGRIWMGGKFEGLKRYNENTGEIKKYVIDNGFSHDSWVSSVDADKKGNVWYGTERGFGVYDIELDSFITVALDSTTELAEFCSSEIIGIVPGKDNYMWVASSLGHLIKIKRKQNGWLYNYYPYRTGSSSRFGQIIMDDEHNLWLKSATELVRRNPKNGAVDIYTSEDGIIKPFLIWPYQNGKILLGQQDGFSIMDPKKVRQKKTPGNLVYSEFYIFDKKKYSAYNIPLDDKITLNFDENYFSISTSLIGVIKSIPSQLQYRLIGLDNKWINSTTGNSVSWTNLEAGNYRLEIRQSLPNGQLLEGPGLDIEIVPPYWKTTWFQLLMISILLVALYLAYRARVNHLLRLKKHQLEVAGLEMKTLRSQMNPHFIFNCLNSIKLFVLEKEYNNAGSYINRFSKLLRTILRNSKQHYISLKDELESLTHYIELEKMRFSDKFDYDIIIHPKLKPEKVFVPPLILQPFVENAIWHGLTPKQGFGHVKVEFTPNGSYIKCIIEDNGVGRKFHSTKQEKRTSFGISITKERLEVLNDIYGMNADIQIIDLFEGEESSGTRVEISLPNRSQVSEIS